MFLAAKKVEAQISHSQIMSQIATYHGTQVSYTATQHKLSLETIVKGAAIMGKR